MAAWFSIENDNMVPTWLFGSPSQTRTAPVNPVEHDNMFPSWLRTSQQSYSRTSQSSATSSNPEHKSQALTTHDFDHIVETKDGRMAEFTVYSYPHSFYCQKVEITRF